MEGKKTIWVTIAVLVLAAAFVVIRQRGAPVMSEPDFMAFVRTRIARDYPQVRLVRENGLGWDYEFNGQGPTTMWLGNVYELYKQQPKDINPVVDRYLKVINEAQTKTPNEWEDVKGRVMPMIWSKEFADDMPVPVVAIPYAHDNNLVILIAIDSPNSVAYARPDDVKKWGISKDDLMKVMLDNLASKTHQLGVLGKGRNTMVACCDGDGYDASRILLPKFIERAKKELGCSRIAVVIPNRDFLTAGSADDPEIVNGLKKIAQKEFQNNPYAITRDVIVLTGN